MGLVLGTPSEAGPAGASAGGDLDCAGGGGDAGAGAGGGALNPGGVNAEAPGLKLKDAALGFRLPKLVGLGAGGAGGPAISTGSSSQVSPMRLADRDTFVQGTIRS